MLVGENWTTHQSSLLISDQPTKSQVERLRMNFNFPLSSAIIQAVKMGNATPIAAKYAEMKTYYPAGINDAPFLTNHDQVRIATELDKNTGKLRNAASILFTLPGAPFVYYGEEVGMQNGTTNNDEAKRTPMPWDSQGGFTTGSPWFAYSPGTGTANVMTETDNPNSLLSHYRNLIAARKSSESLSRGSIEMLSPVTGMYPVLVFLRKTATETVLVAHNVSDGMASAGPFPVTAVSSEKVFSDGNGASISGSYGQWSVSLPPRSCGIWRLK